MMEIRMATVTLGCVLALGVTPTVDAGVSPGELFKQVEATYEGLDTYQSEGTIVTRLDTGGITMNTETSFSIRLKKPNRYLVTWSQKNATIPGMAQSGAVWSDGSQPYLYVGAMNAYAKMSSDEIAIGGATGVSGGAAFNIPSLFLSAFQAQPAPFVRLQEPTLQGIEEVDGEECHVVSGASSISKKETYWISTSRHLVLKYERSLEPPEGGLEMPAMTDEQLDASIKGMGQEVNEESRKRMREMMENSRQMMKTMKMSGLSTESHSGISAPELNADDFTFAPEGAALTDSLFGTMFSGK